MPTVLRIAGFRFMIYTDDHIPAHTHVYHGEESCILFINPVDVRDPQNMKRANLRRALSIAEENQAILLAEWERLHG